MRDKTLNFDTTFLQSILTKKQTRRAITRGGDAVLDAEIRALEIAIRNRKNRIPSFDPPEDEADYAKTMMIINAEKHRLRQECAHLPSQKRVLCMYEARIDALVSGERVRRLTARARENRAVIARAMEVLA